MSVPEISVQDLGEMLKSEQNFIVMDVREHWEIAQAKWDDARVRVLPLSQLAQYGGVEPLEGDTQLIVACHHGIRSAQVVNWLLSQGWENVFSLRGGIEAYATEVDDSVGRY
jgi:rhodanese-related sulfurtransferase